MGKEHSALVPLMNLRFCFSFLLLTLFFFVECHEQEKQKNADKTELKHGKGEHKKHHAKFEKKQEYKKSHHKKVDKIKKVHDTKHQKFEKLDKFKFKKEKKKYEKKVPKTHSLNKQPKSLPPLECDPTGPTPIANGNWKCKRNECQLKGPGCQATAICTVDGWNTTVISECFVCEDKPEVVVEGASWQC